MITLRILITGLIAYGPTPGLNETAPSLWALMAQVPSAASHPHVTELRFGCDGSGNHCSSKIDVKGHDLEILVNGKPLAVNRPLRIDHTFREYVGDLHELAGPGGVEGHHRCGSPLVARRIPATRKPGGVDLLTPLKGLLEPLSTSQIPANLDKVASRLLLTGGHPLVNESCDGGDHCAGKLAARDVEVCRRWEFPTPDPRCARLADTLVYELQIEEASPTSPPTTLEFARRKHSDGTTVSPDINVPISGQKVVEVWVVNAPEHPTGENFDHFAYLYNLFKDPNTQLPNRKIPSFNANGISQCRDLPGLKPVKCPGLAF